MRYIVGIVCLLVAVCAVSIFFVEEGFDNVGGKTPADYYNSVAAQMGSGYVPPATTGTTGMSDADYKTWLQTYADYIGLKSSSGSSGSSGSSDSSASTSGSSGSTSDNLSPDALAILAALASGTKPPVSAKTETDLKLSYNAKSVPEESSSSKSSPGSSEEASASDTTALTQGQAFILSILPGNPPKVTVSPSTLLPSNKGSAGSSYDEEEDDSQIAVNVNGKSSKQCPDMSQYVRKDNIPCWGCKL